MSLVVPHLLRTGLLRLVIVASVCMLVGLSLQVISLQAVAATKENNTIVVGSKNFNESYLLAEVTSRLLEHAGYVVDRRFGLGGTLVCYEALRTGNIDLYIEYTGTVEQVILKEGRLDPDIDDLNQRIDKELRLLGSLGFNNTYAVALKQSLATALGLRKISDLTAHPDLKIAFSLEFMNREDGWPGLARTYGLGHQPSGIDHGLAYQAIDDGQIDVTDAYSTDGDLQRYALTVLADDLAYFPAYYATPFIRRSLPETAVAAISKLIGRIDGDQMRRLNAEILLEGRSFAQVAEHFLIDEGLIDKELMGEEPADAGLVWSSISRNTLVHLKLTTIALVLGCMVGLPLGIYVFRRPDLARVVVYLAGLLQTIPSIALLALMIPLFGIGELPAIVALFLYSILPVLRNTITALITIDPSLKRVAQAIGLTWPQQLWYVLVPLALPNILSGIKTAAIISIGTATLAAFIGAGGLGEPIVTGLALNDAGLIMQGAIPAACLAIIVELLFELLERLVIKSHIRAGQLPE